MKIGNFRARGYDCNPQLLSKAFCQDIFAWLKKNENFVTAEKNRQELERIRAREVQQMPNQALTGKGPQIGPFLENAAPQFNRELLDEIQQKRKGVNR